jgi:hypothetical protein
MLREHVAPGERHEFAPHTPLPQRPGPQQSTDETHDSPLALHVVPDDTMQPDAPIAEHSATQTIATQRTLELIVIVSSQTLQRPARTLNIGAYARATARVGRSSCDRSTVSNRQRSRNDARAASLRA